ncbi:MAG TPA: GAF domain-containing protein [Terriglobia bacterium]|nr:GAF domain-containing protein [Terriglobia bacterium]
MSSQTPETAPAGGSIDSVSKSIPQQIQPQDHAEQDGEPNHEATAQALEQERSALEQTVAQLRTEQQQFLERYVGLEEQNSALTTLYVACQSLHCTLDRAEILLTAREIIANLVGCEEYVLFSVAPDGWLIRVDSFGLDTQVYEKLPPDAGLIGRAVTTGEICQIEEGGGGRAADLEANLTACIPLKHNGVVTGAIALFRLLPQKFELQNLDHELFRLLQTHLAHALHCSELQQRVGAKNGVGA